MSFRFSSTAPPPNYFTTITALNNFDSTQFASLLTIVSDSAFSRTAAAEAGFASFISSHSVKSKPLRNSIQILLSIFSQSLKKNSTLTQLREDLEKLGLSSENGALFASEFAENWDSLAGAALASTVSVNELMDLQWKFGVSASSDECAALGATFLQLKLFIRSGSNIEERLVELSLKQFYAFLNQMQNAKRQMESNKE